MVPSGYASESQAEQRRVFRRLQEALADSDLESAVQVLESRGGRDYAQWRCDMVDTDQEPPLEEAKDAAAAACRGRGGDCLASRPSQPPSFPAKALA